MTRQMRMQADLPLEKLKELLAYSAETGVFIMRTSRGRRRAGAEAGYLNNLNYRMIFIGGKFYLAHRLAWYYVTGEWPTTEIDHINRNPSDNRFANLRLCSRSDNEANSVRRNNRSGFRGVCFLRGKWQASIRKDGKARYLGRFDTPEAASAAYDAAAIALHGDFAFVEKPKPAKQEALL